jgi:hypothetical protein
MRAVDATRLERSFRLKTGAGCQPDGWVTEVTELDAKRMVVVVGVRRCAADDVTFELMPEAGGTTLKPSYIGETTVCRQPAFAAAGRASRDVEEDP